MGSGKILKVDLVKIQFTRLSWDCELELMKPKLELHLSFKPLDFNLAFLHTTSFKFIFLIYLVKCIIKLQRML